MDRSLWKSECKSSFAKVKDKGKGMTTVTAAAVALYVTDRVGGYLVGHSLSLRPQTLAPTKNGHMQPWQTMVVDA